jgi:lipopolysaccharide/colanic/teichoic acid biosynthesis glycosyltransferase
MDLFLVTVAAPLMVPLFLCMALAIKASSRGPVFFGQQRVGRGGRVFRAWKFRTMLVDAEDRLRDYLEQHSELREEWEATHKLADDPRVVTWIGRFLRKSSLDELPQLWNVVKGEMSLVGPRPLPQYHLEMFDEDFRRYREKITPGMTGLWQVNCRTDGDTKVWVKWDTYYIRNWSLALDLQILLRTPKVVLGGKGT